MAEPVILINAFEVPEGERTDSLPHGRSQPSYLDAVLHHALPPDAEFQFVNVARWRTADDFVMAMQCPGFREAAAGLADCRSHPAFYRVVLT